MTPQKRLEQLPPLNAAEATRTAEKLAVKPTPLMKPVSGHKVEADSRREEAAARNDHKEDSELIRVIVVDLDALAEEERLERMRNEGGIDETLEEDAELKRSR